MTGYSPSGPICFRTAPTATPLASVSKTNGLLGSGILIATTSQAAFFKFLKAVSNSCVGNIWVSLEDL